MRARNESGVSLIEIVIAIVILGGVISALMTTLVTASTSSKSHRDLVTADAVLRDYAEATKQAVRAACVNSQNYSVSYAPPSGSGYSVAGAGTVCPPTTGSLAAQVPTVHLTVTLPSGSTKALDITVRTP